LSSPIIENTSFSEMDSTNKLATSTTLLQISFKSPSKSSSMIGTIKSIRSSNLSSKEGSILVKSKASKEYERSQNDSARKYTELLNIV